MEVLVSVLVATYNRAPLLQRCIQSIINQSYKNLEILVIDDNSTDETNEVIRDFMQIDNRIRYKKHSENLKLSACRNTGVRLANGQLIAFMDDDDFWIDKNKIFNQVKIFKDSKPELGMVFTKVRLVDEHHNYLSKPTLLPRNFKEHILVKNSIIYSPSVMIKRDIILELGGFDESVTRGVDSDLYRRFFLRSNFDFHFLEEVTCEIQEFGADRLTKLDSASSLQKHIVNYEYKLVKYVLEFSRYKSGRCETHYILSKLYLQKYFISGNRTDYVNAMEHGVKSASLINWLKLLLLYAKFAIGI